MKLAWCKNHLGDKILKRGTQIAYIPDHADNNLDHADVEYGFITSIKKIEMGMMEELIFCRFWNNNNLDELWTTSCSVCVPIDKLIYFILKPKNVIDEALEKYCDN